MTWYDHCWCVDPGRHKPNSQNRTWPRLHEKTEEHPHLNWSGYCQVPDALSKGVSDLFSLSYTNHSLKRAFTQPNQLTYSPLNPTTQESFFPYVVIEIRRTYTDDAQSSTNDCTVLRCCVVVLRGLQLQLYLTPMWRMSAPATQ